MNINIVEIIKEKEIIKSLNIKIEKLREENVRLNNRIEFISIIFSFLSVFSFYSFIFYLNITKETNIDKQINFYDYILNIIFLFGSGIVLSGLISLIILIIKYFLGLLLFYIDNLNLNLGFDIKSYNKIKKFEKSLNENELKYYTNGFFRSGNNTNQILYDAYFKALSYTDINILIENKEMIINEFKDEFNNKKQKVIYKQIIEIIKENDTEYELNKIDEDLKKLGNKNKIKNISTIENL